MNIFISGGTGFIGSHLTRHYLNDPSVNKITVYDNLTSGSLTHLESCLNDGRLHFVESDIKNLGELTHAMSGANLVVHFAANPDIAKAVKQPDIDFWEGLT